MDKTQQTRDLSLAGASLGELAESVQQTTGESVKVANWPVKGRRRVVIHY